MASIAIIGADGAGKSTVCQAVIRKSGLPLKYVYMGVNLEASEQMLPTTRLWMWAKTKRGLSPDATFKAVSSRDAATKGFAKQLKSLLRLAFWTSEEWYRQFLVWIYEARGFVVIFDRHFFADYFAYDVCPQNPDSRPLASRMHGWMLAKLYPKPNLFILLQAPAHVLYERKREATVEFLEERQDQYLRMASSVERFEVVDATQSTEAVIDEVLSRIRAFLRRN